MRFSGLGGGSEKCSEILVTVVMRRVSLGGFLEVLGSCEVLGAVLNRWGLLATVLLLLLGTVGKGWERLEIVENC